MGARKRILRWAGWFAVANAVLLMVVGLRYLWYYSALTPSPAWIYAILAYVGHLSILACIPLLLLLFPVMMLIPQPRVILPIGVVLGSAGFSLLLLDGLVFAENRYHLSLLTLTMLAPRTWAFLGVYFLLGAAIETMLAVWVWRRTARPASRRIGWYLALGVGGCVAASHLIHAGAEARYYVPVTAFTRYLPLYYPLGDEGQVRLGLVDRTKAREESVIAALAQPADRVLNYPQAPLRCESRPPTLNVLLVVIDAMRADALTPEVAPRLNELTRGAIRFDRHYSGGNSSRAGMFSLFYGLPATYWEAFADFARPPVLMDMFRQNRYQLGVFSSSPVYRGAVGLDRTALARIPNLRLETSSSYPGSSGRDRSLTDEWYQWLDGRDPSRPFFGFLYYNATVAIEPPDDYPPPVPAPPGASKQARLYARYLTAVHYVDSLVGGVLEDLGRRKLLESTVVMVTSDHGMEFDENGQGFTGHGTAFSEYQMHTPLVIRWPGRRRGGWGGAPRTTTWRRRCWGGCSAARTRRRTTRAGRISSRTGNGSGSSPRATRTTR